MKYYQRLRDMREDHDLTQKDVAKLLNTTQPQYVRYETGERELPMHHFITLSKFYNINIYTYYIVFCIASQYFFEKIKEVITKFS